MAEKLTWDEIKKRYPDEYVVLVDTAVDDSTTVVEGTVMAHGKNKHEMRQVLAQIAPKRGGCLWTGTVHGRIRVIRRDEDTA
ncbi:MAG: hypothetical protein HY815_10095 [Candidatus Riflebacteria bacterium]|nr:hypothetical protein [Candidatus Riflebacteria bacterium]